MGILIFLGGGGAWLYFIGREKYKDDADTTNYDYMTYASYVVWGLAATSLLLLKSEGMLEAYAPAGVDKLDPKFVDTSTPPTWVGMDAWVASVCYNTVEAKKHNLTPPKTWKDLTDAKYKGHVIIQEAGAR